MDLIQYPLTLLKTWSGSSTAMQFSILTGMTFSFRSIDLLPFFGIYSQQDGTIEVSPSSEGDGRLLLSLNVSAHCFQMAGTH